MRPCDINLMLTLEDIDPKLIVILYYDSYRLIYPESWYMRVENDKLMFCTKSRDGEACSMNKRSGIEVRHDSFWPCSTELFREIIAGPNKFNSYSLMEVTDE